MSLERTVPARLDASEPVTPGIAKSAAWLQAESLFAAPPRAPDLVTAVVTIRRSRFAAAAPDEVLFEPGGAQPSLPNLPNLQLAKGPRVFRVDAERSEAAASPADAASAIAEAAPASPLLLPMPAVPKRRIAFHKRPGPVLRIVPPPSDAAADPQAQRAMAATAPREQASALSEMLARVDRILVDIQAARSFRVVDERFADTWHGLSRRAERLHEQLA